MDAHFADFSFLSALLSLIKRFLKTPSISIYDLSSQLKDSKYYAAIQTQLENFLDHLNTIVFIFRKTARAICFSIEQKKHLEPELLFITYLTIYCDTEAGLQFLDLSKKSKYKTNVIALFNSFFEKLKTFSFEIALKGKIDEEQISIRYSLPSFFVKKMIESYGLEMTKKEIEIMNTDRVKNYEHLRIRFLPSSKHDLSQLNNYIIDIHKNIDDISKKLEELGIEKSGSIELPLLTQKGWIYSIKKSDKPFLLKSQLYNQQKIIFHDLSSIFAVVFLDARPYEFIFDMCAAPTIKTDLINQLSFGMSKIIAADFSHSRLKDSLLANFPELNIHLICQDSSNPALRPYIRFDRVLLDAPCTGSGTFPQNPQAKMHQSQKFLNDMVTIQTRLLQTLQNVCHENSVVIYAVCSLYPEEGELQIKKFMEEMNQSGKITFEILQLNDLKNLIPKTSKADLSSKQEILSKGQIFPSMFFSNGFYIAKFKCNIAENF